MKRSQGPSTQPGPAERVRAQAHMPKLSDHDLRQMDQAWQQQTDATVRVASVIDTCRLRCASATDFLARAIHAARLGLPAPALAPIPANLTNPNTDLVGV